MTGVPTLARDTYRHGDLRQALISAGLDLSLHLVATLSTTAHAQATARQMDYAWRR